MSLAAIPRHDDGRLKLSQEENRRFLTKITFEPGEDGCWVFSQKRALNSWYGLFWLHGSNELAHRLSYQMFVGPIQDGLQVCHSCDRPECVRPSHLFVGTGKDNAQDSVQKGRRVRGEDQHFSKLTERDVLSIRERVVKGETTTALAAEFGVAQGIISSVSLGRTWRHVGGPIKLKARRGNPRLSSQQVLEIRRKRSSGMKLREIGEQYGIAECTVSAICTKRIWKEMN